MTEETLKDWILNNKVLDIIFGENTHIEIVKRGGSILKFLAKQNALPEDSVELIWRCQQGKHAEMVRVVYSIIQELVPSIDVRYVDNFFVRISQVSNATRTAFNETTVPASQYDDKFLEFLKEFTLKALENFFKTRTQECQMEEQHARTYDDIIKEREAKIVSNFKQYLSDPTSWNTEDKQYGLPIFWELIQDRAVQVTAELS